MYNLLNFFILKKLIAMYGCSVWWGYTPLHLSTPPVLSSAMYDPTPPYTVHVAPQPMDMSSISLNLGAIQ